MSNKARNVLLEMQYLPSLEYFACLFDKEILILEANETFQKQTYRNRCSILSANGVSSLVIPVLGAGKNFQTKDIKIDYQQKWLNTHWRAICSAYGKSPFFEFYADYFNDVFQKKYDCLFELNFHLLTLCLKCLQIDLEIKFTDEFSLDRKKGEIDLRSTILPKTSFNDRFYYRPIAYTQIFGKDFVPNLSIIDLIFCEGPNARVVLKQSVV